MTRFRLRPALATAALALVLALGFQVGGAFSSDDDTEQARKVAEAFRVISEAYVEDVDSAQLAESAIEGMLADLDPHSIYISADEMRAVRESFNASFDGIGIYYEWVDGAAEQDTLVVLMPIAGGPSEEAGLEAGDRIVMIGDTLALGFDSQMVQKYLKGPRGTTVDLTVKRPGFREDLNFTITRDRIPLETVVSTYMLDDQTGYIKLQRFARTSHREVVSAIRDLRRQGMERLILDLRDNAGGLLDQAYAISDEFLPAGEMIVYTDSRHPRNRNEYIATSGGSYEEDPLIVLINESSASASEIVAGAVQDHDRGLLVGRRSFGKGLVQQQFPLTDGSVLQMTVSRYFTPVGRLIQTPYEVGGEDEEYFAAKGELSEAISDRLSASGMVDADALIGVFPDSLQYQTDAGRTVYGGGGIFPDYVVALDTLSTAAQVLLGRGLDNLFARDFVAENSRLADDWAGREQAFAREYTLPEGTFAEFLQFVEGQGVTLLDEAPQEGDDGVSRADAEAEQDTIETRLRAFVARRVFGIDAFFPVVGQIDETLQQANRLWDSANQLASR
ncbi:MAG: S41 family peptidase [Bacteroidota bacterium]